MKKRHLFVLLLLLAGWAGAEADTTETYDFATWAQSYYSANNAALALSAFAGSTTVTIGSNTYTVLETKSDYATYGFAFGTSRLAYDASAEGGSFAVNGSSYGLYNNTKWPKLAILGLKAGDEVTITFDGGLSPRNSDGATLRDGDGNAVSASTSKSSMTSGTTYTVATAGDLPLYYGYSGSLIKSIVVTVKEQTSTVALTTETATAQSLLNSYTGKTGDGIFFYPADNYNALNTEIATANALLANSTATEAQMEAEVAALKQAEEKLKATVQNQPDADKYYFLSQTINEQTRYISLAWNSTGSAAIGKLPYAIKFVANEDGTFKLYDAVTGKYVAAGTGTTYQTGNDSEYANMEIEPSGDGSTITIHPVKANSGQYLNAWDVNSTELKASASNYKWTVAEATEATANLAVTSAKWGTFVAPFSVSLTGDLADVKAFTTTVADGNLVLTAVEDSIQANTPVLVYSESEVNVSVAGTNFSTIDGTVSATDDNYLAGAYTDYTIAAGNYILQSQTSGTAFFKIDADREATNNRAFLDGSKFDNASAKPLVVSSLTTGIDNAKGEAATGNAYYSISGLRLQRPAKGLNIVNGKKVILK